MNALHWFVLLLSLAICSLHLCQSSIKSYGRHVWSSSASAANSATFTRQVNNSKNLKEVFETLNVKPVFASNYRNVSKATTVHRQRFSAVDAKLAIVGLVTLGGIAFLTPFLPPFIKQRVSESLESRQSFQGIVTNVLVGISESLMTWVENSLDDVPSLPRLDAQECMKRSVCEAHNQPKKYGLLGLFLQLFFPPYTETEEPSKIVSKYQLAARYGRQENANCGAQYDGCMMNFLELLRALANLISP